MRINLRCHVSYLPFISHLSPIYLPFISHAPPMHLHHIAASGRRAYGRRDSRQHAPAKGQGEPCAQAGGRDNGQGRWRWEWCGVCEGKHAGEREGVAGREAEEVIGASGALKSSERGLGALHERRRRVMFQSMCTYVYMHYAGSTCSCVRCTLHHVRDA